MFLARVTGNVVATQKDKTLNGQKLLVVEPLNVKYDEATKQPASLGNTGRAIVAIDVVGAGEGQLVQIAALLPDAAEIHPARSGAAQPAVEHRHRHAGLAQTHGRGAAGDPSADDADVDCQAFAHWGAPRTGMGLTGG